MPDEVVTTPSAPASFNPETATGDEYFNRRLGGPVAETPPDPPAEPVVEPAAEPVVEPPAEPVAEPVEPVVEPEIKVEKPDSRTTRIKSLESLVERQSQQLERVLGALEAAKQPEPPAAPVEAQPEPKPKREAFDNPDDFESSLVEWSAREAVRVHDVEVTKRATEAKAKAETEAAANAQNEAAQTMIRDWTAKVDAVKEKYEDWEDVAMGKHPVSPAMAYGMTTVENGAELAYWLGQNPTEAERIAAIKDPARQVVEIGILSAKLTPPPVIEKPKPSRLPAPITPIASGRAAASTFDPETASGDDYYNQRIGHYQKQRAGAGRSMN